MSSPDRFPAVDVLKQLHPETNKEFQVDPISASVVTSKEIKEQFEEEERREREEQKRKDDLQNLKTTLIVSGIVVAVAGAVFAIAKKLNEKLRD